MCAPYPLPASPLACEFRPIKSRPLNYHAGEGPKGVLSVKRILPESETIPLRKAYHGVVSKQFRTL